MKIKDVMNGYVAVIPPDTTLLEAAQIMKARNIGFLPVVSKNDRRDVIGVLTDRDIVMRCICNRFTVTTSIHFSAFPCSGTCGPMPGAGELFRLMRAEMFGW